MNSWHAKISLTGSPELTGQQKLQLSRFAGKYVTISIDQQTRSYSQNRLYWKFLSVIEQETGNNANELHEYYRRILLPPKFITVKGKELKIPMSTTELSKNDFSEYMDKISADCEIPVPDPHDAGYMCNVKGCPKCK